MHANYFTQTMILIQQDNSCNYTIYSSTDHRHSTLRIPLLTFRPSHLVMIISIMTIHSSKMVTIHNLSILDNLLLSKELNNCFQRFKIQNVAFIYYGMMESHNIFTPNNLYFRQQSWLVDHKQSTLFLGGIIEVAFQSFFSSLILMTMAFL